MCACAAVHPRPLSPSEARPPRGTPGLGTPPFYCYDNGFCEDAETKELRVCGGRGADLLEA